jgi:uncharacterized protein (DUF697 family)
MSTNGNAKASYHQTAKNEINKWENEGPGWLNNVGNFILKPAQKMAEAIIPPHVQENVAKAIENFLGTLSKASSQTLKAPEIKVKVEAACLGTSKSFLEAADDEAKRIWNWHLSYAATEGGLTGAVGLLGLAADVPALFTIVIRLMQQIGTCYGYDMTKPEEQEYVLHILRVASAGDVKTKIEALVVLKKLEEILLGVAWKVVAQDIAARQLSRLALMAGLQELSRSLSVSLTQRKALQSIPVVGALVGASFNANFANDIGRAAYMSYRRRWIAEQEIRPKLTPTPPQS